MVGSITAFVRIRNEDAAIVSAIGIFVDGDAARFPDVIFEIVRLGTGLGPIGVTAGSSRDADGIDATRNRIARVVASIPHNGIGALRRAETRTCESDGADNGCAGVDVDGNAQGGGLVKSVADSNI